MPAHEELIKPSNDATFHSQVLSGSGLKLVDFGASWCAACQALLPILAAFAKENVERLRVFSLDVDQNPATADAFAVRGLPTLLFFRDGAVVDRLVGNVSRSRLQAAFEAAQDATKELQ